jgi:ammonium transporter Rh
MFIGFGFLMTFLKRYGFSSVGFNFLITAYVIQWSLLIRGWIEQGQGNNGKFEINVIKLENNYLIPGYCILNQILYFKLISS